MGRQARIVLVILPALLASGVGVASAQRTRPETAAAVEFARRLSRLPAEPGAEPADPLLQLRVSRRAPLAPGNIASLVRVDPRDGNRVLRVTLDSELFFRSSDVQLNGRRGIKSHFFEWGDLPAGNYQLIVTVYGDDGPIRTAVREIEVIGSTLIGR